MQLTNKDKATCVQLCINCYEGRHGKVDWTNIDKKTIEYFNVDKYKEGYFAVLNHPEHGKIFCIVHEGSDDKHDWQHNFDAILVKNLKKRTEDQSHLVIPYGNISSRILMHHGFLKYYNKIRDMIRKKAEEAHKKGMKIWITGHSLGGAITTVNYIDLHYYFSEIKGVDPNEFLTGYAAASPKVGNKYFVKSFNKRSNGNFYNEWYGNDTVNGVPTWWMGYKHVGKKKRWANIFANTIGVLIKTLSVFNTLPSLAVWDHDPRKLLAILKGEKVPIADPDTSD